MGLLLTGDKAREFASKAQPDIGLDELADHWKSLPGHRGYFKGYNPFEKVWVAFTNENGNFQIQDFRSEQHARAWIGL